VTISYGAFPNDVFLLFFGFVPDPNPHDAVPLFADLADLATAAAQAAAQQDGVYPARSSASMPDTETGAGTPGAERAGAAAAKTPPSGGSLSSKSEYGEPATAAAASRESTAAAVTDAAAGASTAVQQASKLPSPQQTAQRAEEKLLNRLPAGDYSRCRL